jgi:phosphoribosylaminoimidazole-succinocarboxamide synthase
MVNEEDIKNQVDFVLEATHFEESLEPGSFEKYEGKVRDNYIVDGKRIIVVTDRLSAFDVILTTLPFKGQVLNQMTNFWMEKTKSIVPNHIIESPDPNVTVARELKPIPVEFVVRGYITGVTTTSMWHNYEKGVRNFCGHKLPEGLKKDQKLDVPLVTPSTKAEKGQHDESISRDGIIKRKLMDGDEFDEVSEIALKLFEFGQKTAAKNGIILVDTKYEFGRDDEGELYLIDEIHTPDSSRFWYKDSYHELFSKGQEQKKIDKEYVRKWCADQGFTGKGEPPIISDDVRVEAARRYIEAFETVTGEKMNVKVGNVNERLAKNLKRYFNG